MMVMQAQPPALTGPAASIRAPLRRLTAVLRVATLLGAAATAAAAAPTDLRPLLNAPGTTVSLNASVVYTITEYALAVSKTLLCNGATIRSTGGPIRISGAGKRLIVDNCVIEGTGWALLGALSGADLVVRNNTRLTGNGENSAMYVSGATVDLRNSSVTGCLWGVHMENADALISATAISNSTFAVQNVAGTVTLENGCRLENVDPVRQGIGVSLIPSATYPTRGASAVIHDSTFVGFQNAVDIQPSAAQGLPPGTVEIVNCQFDDAFSSALSAIDAVDVRFANSRVNRAKTDGVYLVNSTGTIENSEILGSLNTGVTFLGCQSGATLRNSLVSGSVHQGVAVGHNPLTGHLSRYIQIVDNTLRDNVIANVYVDSYSDALLQGNLLSGAPDFSLRLQGTPGVRMIGELLLDSGRGLEMKDGEASAALSFFTGHQGAGALIYNSAAFSFAHCAHQDNLRSAQAADFSVFAATGGLVTLRRNVLGPAGSWALYNDAGNTATATRNFWGHASGPRPPGGSASGALIGWTTPNGSSLTYQPFLSTAPLDAVVNRSVTISAGATTSWTPFGDLTLGLTGATGITSVSRVAASLRVRDTTTMTTPAPLGGTMRDGIFVVWADYDLVSRAQSGSLRVRTVGSGATAGLYRLQPDGSWLRLTTAWNAGSAEVVYSASDPRTLNGIFALVDLPPEREPRARALITSYYTQILGRGPEAGAVDAWYYGYFVAAVNLSVDVRFVPHEMGRLFFLSQEYASRNRTNAQFIRDCYEVFLRRTPAQSEVDAWLGDSSWNRPQVIALFAQSTEFSNYIRGAFPGITGVPIRNLVTAMYVGLLDRLVDGAGLAYFAGLFEWTYAIAGIEGVRGEARTLGRLTLASAEYRSKNPTNATHVERLYRGFLGRFPATSELNYWRSELDAGRQTTDSLLDAFAASNEFTALLNTTFGQL